MAAVASSQTARAAIEKSQVAKDAIAASDMATAKYAVGAAGLKPADYANMAAVAASQTAMAAIANNKTAITAVEASSAAKNALYNSPLKTTMSSVQSTSSWVTRRSGKIWLISFKQTWGSGSNTMQHRYTLKDSTTLSCTATQSYNTDYRIDRFMDSITNYNNAGGIGAACTYVFIPC